MAETKAITLDLKLPNNTVVRANQYDSNSTAIQIRLTSQGKKYTVPPENDVYVKVKSPSGKMILNKCFINSNGTVNVILTKNMTATAGRCRAQLIIADHGHTPIEGDEEVTYTSSFIINVVESVYSGEEFKQSSESDVFFDYVNQAKQSAEKAEKAAEITGTGMKTATSDSIGAIRPDNKTTFVDKDGVLRAVSSDAKPVDIDSELNKESTNPVSNQVITEKFETVSADLLALTEKVDGIKIPEIPEVPTPEYDIDLNDSSENAVQNKTLTAKFKELSEQIQNVKNTFPDITIDKDIADSDNPVENRAIKAALESIESRIGQIMPNPGKVEIIDSKPDPYYNFASIDLFDSDAAKVYIVHADSNFAPPSKFPETSICKYTVKNSTSFLTFWLKAENIDLSDLVMVSDNEHFVPQMEEHMGYMLVGIEINLENPYTVTTANIKFSSATTSTVFAEIIIDYSVKQSAQGVKFYLDNAIQPIGSKIKIEPTWSPEGVPAPEYIVKKTYNEGATTLSYEDGFYYVNVVDVGRDAYTIISTENEQVNFSFSVLGSSQNSPFENANPTLISESKRATDGSVILSSLNISDEMLDANDNYEIPRSVGIGTHKYPLVIDADNFTLSLDTTKDIDTLSFAKGSVARMRSLTVKSSTHVVKTFKLKNVTTDTSFYITHAYNNSKSEWYEASNNKTITVDYEGADLSKLKSLSCAHWNTYTYADSVPNSYKRINAPILNSKVNGTYQEKEWKDYKDYDATCIIRNLTITDPSVTINKIIPCFPHVKFENCSINVTSGEEIASGNGIVRTIEGLGEALNHEAVTTFCRAFYQCYNLESVDIFNENPYIALEDISQMFNLVGNLRSITVDVTGVKKMDNMFSNSYVANCVKLIGKPAANCTGVLDFASGATIKTIDVSEYDLSEQDVVSIFSNYGYVENLDLSKTKFKDGVKFTNVVPFGSGQYYTFKNFVLPSNISKAIISVTREDTSTVFKDVSGNMYYAQSQFNIDELSLVNTFVQTYDYKKKGGNK